MKTFLPSGIALAVVFTMFYQCQPASHVSSLPQAITSYTDTLSQDTQPVKFTTDHISGRVYWLSFVGGLHSIRLDGSQHRHINQGDDAWKDVTFIEDFCMDQEQTKLYFTDILDLKTGQSAIKTTDIEGKEIEVVSYLSDEIPYHISVSADKKMIFYLSKSDAKNSAYYRLKFIDLQQNIKGTLYTSAQRIDSLNYDKLTQTVNIQHEQQEQLTFSTDLKSMTGLTEAFE